jgi:hypothetical protein
MTRKSVYAALRREGRRASIGRMNEIPEHPAPRGPEDPSPGCSVHLTSDQARAVRRLTRDHPHGVTIRDRDATYIAVELIGPEGELVKGWTLTYAGVPPVAEPPPPW